jgi:hypothetical protein
MVTYLQQELEKTKMAQQRQHELRMKIKRAEEDLKIEHELTLRDFLKFQAAQRRRENEVGRSFNQCNKTKDLRAERCNPAHQVFSSVHHNGSFADDVIINAAINREAARNHAKTVRWSDSERPALHGRSIQESGGLLENAAFHYTETNDIGRIARTYSPAEMTKMQEKRFRRSQEHRRRQANTTQAIPESEGVNQHRPSLYGEFPATQVSRERGTKMSSNPFTGFVRRDEGNDDFESSYKDHLSAHDRLGASFSATVDA